MSSKSTPTTTRFHKDQQVIYIGPDQRVGGRITSVCKKEEGEPQQYRFRAWSNDTGDGDYDDRTVEEVIEELNDGEEEPITGLYSFLVDEEELSEH